MINVIFIADSEQSEKDAQDKMEEIADRWVSKLEGKYLYVRILRKTLRKPRKNIRVTIIGPFWKLQSLASAKPSFVFLSIIF